MNGLRRNEAAKPTAAGIKNLFASLEKRLNLTNKILNRIEIT